MNPVPVAVFDKDPDRDLDPTRADRSSYDMVVDPDPGLQGLILLNKYPCLILP